MTPADEIYIRLKYGEILLRDNESDDFHTIISDTLPMPVLRLALGKAIALHNNGQTGAAPQASAGAHISLPSVLCTCVDVYLQHLTLDELNTLEEYISGALISYDLSHNSYNTI